jgi:opacity protein-like surface antigen
MHLRACAALLVAGLALSGAPATAQRTGDRARLVFTVSGTYIGGTGLWTVPVQPVEDQLPADTFFLSRNIKRTFGAGFAGSYYPGAHLGLSVEAFLIGLGYEDTCRLLPPPGQNARNVSLCGAIDRRDRSAASVVFSVGGIYRVASREFISPFVSAGGGFLFNNVSSILTSGFVSTRTETGEFVLYDDDDRTRIRPAFRLGAGATVALAKAYHLRVEVRDNIVGIERVTGVKPTLSQIPPHENTYKSLWSVHVGVDVILERQRGRRY